MGKPDTWMPMYWGKFFLDTSEFDDALTGAYAALLGHCWTRGGWLPDDDEKLARLARCTPARWKKHRAVLSQPPYFTVDGGRWTQKRLTHEIEKATRTYTSSVENGKLGGRPKKVKGTQSQTGKKPGGYEKANPAETDKTLERKNTEGSTSSSPSENQGFASQTLSGKEPDDGFLEPSINGHDRKADSRKQMVAEAVSILSFLNEKAGRNYQPVPANVDPIVTLMKQGFTPQVCRQVIVKKAREWKADPEMESYVRPKTLFNRTNFANYAGEIIDPPDPETP